MAFAKTPKRLELAVNLANFKIGLKFQVVKNHKFAEFDISCPMALPCLTCELLAIEPRSTE